MSTVQRSGRASDCDRGKPVQPGLQLHPFGDDAFERLLIHVASLSRDQRQKQCCPSHAAHLHSEDGLRENTKGGGTFHPPCHKPIRLKNNESSEADLRLFRVVRVFRGFATEQRSAKGRETRTVVRLLRDYADGAFAGQSNESRTIRAKLWAA